MVKKGDRINNPITGETIVFQQTAQDTAGALLQFTLLVKPGGHAAAPHIHPEQEERFQVKSGTLRLGMGGDEQLLRSDDKGVVPAGAPHAWWNEGEDELEALVEFRPALHTQDELSTLFALAKGGLVDKKGMPNLLQTAVTIRKYRSEMYLAKPAIAVQKVLFAILAPIGRMLGYQADYIPCPDEKYSRAGILESPHYSGC